eukprot:gene7324-5160_t
MCYDYIKQQQKNNQICKHPYRDIPSFLVSTLLPHIYFLSGAAATLPLARFNALVERTKRQLLQCGPNAVRLFSRALNLDSDFGGTKVDKDTFRRAVETSGIPLTEEEIDSIFTRLDRTGSSAAIDPTEFIAALRYDFSALRGTWLQRTWRCFNKDRRGNAKLSDVRSLFQPQGHPAVLRGTRDAADVQREFFAAFNESTNPNGMVSRQDFEQYYGAISCTVFDDETYLATLRGCWPIPGVCQAYTRRLATGEAVINHTFSAFQENEELNRITRLKNLKMELERVASSQHRSQVLQAPLAVRRLTMSFQRRDPKSIMFLSVSDFKEALREHRIYFPNLEVLEVLDTNGDGSVDYLYYLALLLPKLAPTRRMMLERMWNKALPPKDCEDGVEVLAFQRCFNATNGQELSNFLDAWDVQQVVGRKVYLWEVEHWYVAQSIHIEADKDFEALLTRQKNCSSRQSTTKRHQSNLLFGSAVCSSRVMEKKKKRKEQQEKRNPYFDVDTKLKALETTFYQLHQYGAAPTHGYPPLLLPPLLFILFPACSREHCLLALNLFDTDTPDY